MKMKDFDALLKLVEKHPLRKVAVAVAEDPSVIEAIGQARKRSIAEAVLVGNERKIRDAAKAANISLDGTPIVNEPESLQAVARAVRLASSGQADILMKGYVQHG